MTDLHQGGPPRSTVPNTMQLTNPVFLELLQASLQHRHDDIPAQARLVPRLPDGSLARVNTPPPGVQPRHGAVLIVLYPGPDADLWLPLTVRSHTLRQHRGEIALPGGAIDHSDASPIAAALREAHEEVALPPQQVTVWGTLSDVYIAPSNFSITPVVAWATALPPLYPAEAEVAEIINVPLRHLLDPATLKVEQRTLRGQTLLVPYFAWQHHKIWGATSVVLSQLVTRVEWAWRAFVTA